MSKILIVDDEPNIVMALDYALQKQGFTVLIARDGQEALDIVKKDIPKVIILDIMMPKVDGFEVLNQLKSNPKTRDITVIILSAKNKTKDIENGLKAGANEYLAKPFSTKKLIEKIKSYC
ncbi:MAG: response regulator transcription factor [Psychroflexus salarius]